MGKNGNGTKPADSLETLRRRVAGLGSRINELDRALAKAETTRAELLTARPALASRVHVAGDPDAAPELRDLNTRLVALDGELEGVRYALTIARADLAQAEAELRSAERDERLAERDRLQGESVAAGAEAVRLIQEAARAARDSREFYAQMTAIEAQLGLAPTPWKAGHRLTEAIKGEFDRAPVRLNLGGFWNTDSYRRERAKAEAPTA